MARRERRRHKGEPTAGFSGQRRDWGRSGVQPAAWFHGQRVEEKVAQALRPAAARGKRMRRG